MSLKLVAYDSDDENNPSNEEEVGESHAVIVERKSSKELTSVLNDKKNNYTRNSSNHTQHPHDTPSTSAVKTNVNSSGITSDSISVKLLNDVLPKPSQPPTVTITASKGLSDIVVVDKKSKRIKIAIPSLDELEYGSDEEEAGPKRKITPAEGCSLMSFLPKPKNAPAKVISTVSVSSLVPQSVARPKPNIPPAKKPQNMLAKTIEAKDVNMAPADFFSLGDESLRRKTDKEASINLQPNIQNTIEPKPEVELSYNEILMKKLEEDGQFNGDSNSPPSSPTAVPTTSSSIKRSYQPPPDMDINDPAYKKFIASKFGEDLPEQINIVDVNVSQYLRGNTELIKAVSMEKASEVKGPAPNPTAKRKHQITYLAFQAQQRELDLKNQAAANRFTKAQTKKKYGF